MNWTGRSLALRLTVWFLLLSSAPMAVVSMAVGVEARAALGSVVSHRHEALAHSLAHRWLDGEVEARRWVKQPRASHQVMVIDGQDQVVCGQDDTWDGQLATHWLPPETLREIHATDSGHGESVNGRYYGFSHARAGGSDLAVVVFSSTDELRPPMAELIRSVLTKLGASLLLVALAGGLFIWAAVGGPLRTLTRAAEQVAEGDLVERVPMDQMDDELAVLAGSFNRMTDSLARSMADLATSQERFRAMLDSLDDAVFVHDGEGRLITDANPAACAMFGLTRDEFVGRSVADLSDGRPPFDAAHAVERCQRALAGERQVFEWRVRHSDGSLRWAEVSLSRGLIGGQDRLLAVIRDVDARKRAEAELAESRRRMAAMLDTTRLCAAMVDVDGRLVYANEAFGQAMGGRAAQLLGVDWFAEMVVDPDGQLRADYDAMVAAGTGVAHQQYTMTTLDGRERQFVWDRTLLMGPDGEPVGASSIGRDVTDELELQERLRQSAKMQAIGQLAGGVAHDFNNLLTTILGYTEVMLAEPGPYEEELGEVLRATERASSLTHQLLAFSRKQMLQPSVTDLNRIVAGMDRMLRRLIGEHIDLTYQPGADLPPVLVDRGQMEQVLLNLALNARDEIGRASCRERV